MKAKRLIALALAAVFLLSAAATPAFAAAQTEQPAVLAEQNDIVSIRIKAVGDLTYGSPYQLQVETTPADAQYLGVVLGTGGEAKGYVTLVLSDKIRTLLKMIPLPKMMSKTPDQEEEFNIYGYLKQLIDGNDVSVLLRVADEVVSVMDALNFYIPSVYVKTVSNVSNSMKLALELIRKYLPAGALSRIYLDEQPFDSGSYIAGAVALETGDLNSAGVAMFKIKPKSSGVSLRWAADVPGTVTVDEVRALNLAAALDSDGQTVDNAKISYTYKKKGLLVDKSYDTLPAEPGTYQQTAKVSGNYSCSSITRTITVR